MAAGILEFYGRYSPSLLPPLTKSRQNDNTHKYVAGNNTTITRILFAGFSFGWGQAEKRRLRWMGINIARKSDLPLSRRRSDTRTSKFQENGGGQKLEHRTRGSRGVAGCLTAYLSVCLYTRLLPSRGGTVEPQRNVQR